jgi:hypothetical protein
MTKQPTFRDIKKLSAYLDKQLSKSAQARLEARLAEQPELQEILLEMRQARALLKHTPRHRVPRNFTLTPKMVGMRPPVSRSVPVFRFASITAAVLLFISFTFNYLAPIVSAPSQAAALYQYAGGKGGGCDTSIPGNCEDVAMEAVPYGIGGGPAETATPEELAAMSEAPATMDAITPEATPEASMRAMDQPTQDAINPSPETPAIEPLPSEKSQPQSKPYLNIFQTGLVLLVFVFGSSAFLIRQINIQRWRKRQ